MSQALTASQHELLAQIEQGRVWRVGQRFQLVRLRGDRLDLEPGTVRAMLTDNYISEVETYGRDRSLYEINAHGKAMLSAAGRAS
jgi:hypothetical protein